jgi:hypothetical protein
MVEQPHQGSCEISHFRNPERDTHPSIHISNSIPLSTPAIVGLRHSYAHTQLSQLDTPNTREYPNFPTDISTKPFIGHNNPPLYHLNGKRGGKEQVHQICFLAGSQPPIETKQKSKSHLGLHRFLLSLLFSLSLFSVFASS